METPTKVKRSASPEGPATSVEWRVTLRERGTKALKCKKSRQCTFPGVDWGTRDARAGAWS